MSSLPEVFKPEDFYIGAIHLDEIKCYHEAFDMEKTGFIYVLTNESFHRENWIKIGYAEDVNKRVKELSGTSVPLPYEVYCTYEIPRIVGAKDPDKLLHDLITKLNPSLRISPNREFFEMLPTDAYDMLVAIAQMHGRLEFLHLNEANTAISSVQSDDDYTVEALFPTESDIYPLYKRIKEIVASIDSSLVESPKKLYVAFKKNDKNTISIWPKSGWIEVVLTVRTGQLKNDYGLVYDITNRKWSSCHYAFRFTSNTDTSVAKEIIKQNIELKAEALS